MISVKCTGDFNKTNEFLLNASKFNIKDVLNKYGKEGVNALASATPKDTGYTANAWDYTIQTGKGATSITWTNSNVEGGVPIVILLQYGHGTRNGGYVSGVDFINPAIKSTMERIANEAWKEVTK